MELIATWIDLSVVVKQKFTPACFMWGLFMTLLLHSTFRIIAH
jgi:hypothetical protein